MAQRFEKSGRTIQGVFDERGGGRLVVFVHGMNKGPDSLEDVRKLVRAEFPDADLFLAKLPMSMFSLHRAMQLAERLSQDIAAIDSAGAYDDVILIGHSAGAMLMRAAWLHGRGCCRNGVIDAALMRPWAGKVSRMVLLAAVNRGWSNTSPSLPGRLGLWLGSIYEMLLHTPLEAIWKTSGFAFENRRGAAYITTVRLQWLRVSETDPDGVPLVVQVLGTVDEIVAPSDNVDLVTGARFFYLEAPRTGHSSIVRLSDPKDGADRARVVRLALVGDETQLAAGGLTHEQVQDAYSEGLDDFDMDLPQEALKKGQEVRQAIFILHGIRDYGYWTKKLAGRIKTAARSLGDTRTVTSSYGYFPMGPFIMRSARRKRVEWFMDQYVRARAYYPNATFSFFGHSNGTYLLAGALEDCPAIRFERVGLAGSVVRRDYKWADRLATGQVRQVVNIVATGDWVVAIFPRFLQLWRGFGLGSAGHDGFRRPLPTGLTEIHFVSGDHGAALHEDHWDAIADFVVHGRQPATLGQTQTQTRWVRLAGNATYLVLPALLVGLGFLAIAIFQFAAVSPALALIAMGLYIWAITSVLTKV